MRCILISSAQLRAARALLRLDQSDLAKSSGVSVETIKRLEKMEGPLLAATGTTLAKLQSALTEAGVIFIDPNGIGPGVRLRDPQP